jgi:hypothetical protein
MPEPIIPTPDSGAGDPPKDGPGSGTPPTPPEPPKKLEFTQEEFDRIIADRVTRAKPKDYDDLLKLKAEREAAAEKEKTDLQKEKDARLAAEAQGTERVSKADAKLRRAAIMLEAAAQNAADTDIVLALLAGNDTITVDDDGEVLGVKEAVKKLLKDKPVLVKGSGGSSTGGEFGGNDPATLAEQITSLERQGKYKEARELKMQQMANLRA